MIPAVLITGAKGFLGSRLCECLSGNNDFSVIGGARTAENGPSGFTLVEMDITDRRAVNDVFSKHRPVAVVHAAAAIGSGTTAMDVRTMNDNNVMGTANLLASAMEHGCERFVFCSSESVYDGSTRLRGLLTEEAAPAPENAYGWSKLAGEELLRICSKSGGPAGVTLRLAGIHGPGRPAGVVYHYLRAALEGSRLKVNEPETRMRPLFIDDALQAVELALSADLPASYNCYNTASEDAFSLRRLAETVIEETGSVSGMDAADGTGRQKDMEIDKIRHELGYVPGPLRRHLDRYITYLKQQGRAQ